MLERNWTSAECFYTDHIQSTLHGEIKQSCWWFRESMMACSEGKMRLVLFRIFRMNSENLEFEFLSSHFISSDCIKCTMKGVNKCA